MSTLAYRVRPSGTIGRALRILLMCTGAVALLVGLLAAGYLSSHRFVIHAPPLDRRGPPPAFSGPSSPWVGLLWLPSLGSLATIVLWLVWQHLVTANLWARRYPGLRIKPGWAVGWWFIPFANLVMPLVAMLEVDRRSTPDGAPRRASPLLGCWWAAWVGQQVLPAIAIWSVSTGALARMTQRIDENTTTVDFTPIAHGVAPWIGFAGVLQGVAAVLAYLVVRRIDEAQVALVEAGDEPPPRPDVWPR